MPSELPAAPGVQDDLRDEVPAQAELLRDLVRIESLLVVEQRQPLLGPAPGLPGDPRPLGFRPPFTPFTPCRRSRGAGLGRSRGAGLRLPGRRRQWDTEGATPLIMVFAAGEVLFGLLVEYQILLGQLVDPDGHHGQALGVLPLALGRHAVVVFPGSLGMKFRPARNALVHL